MAKKEVKNSKDKTSFMKSFKAELKKVIWPTPKQLFNNTVAVLSIVIITAVIVFVLDFAFNSINEFGIDKIKQVVRNSTTNEIVNQNNEEAEANLESNETTTNEVVNEENTESVE